MKKLALGALFLGLMACGSDGNKNNSVVVPDGNTGTDAPLPGVCSPTLQTGCESGEKCTWIQDSDTIGHIGCVAEAATPKAIGEACDPPAAGAADDCAKGSVCLGRECKQICDVDGGTPACDENHACSRYAHFFEYAGDLVAGVCDPGCDPLTQDLKIGTNKTACGSTDPTAPNRGCYGYFDFSCTGASPDVLTLTDRQPAVTDSASGNAYINGCAPGYVPLFTADETSTITVCQGICAAAPIDNEHTGNFQGDSTALGKDVTAAEAVEGGALCSAAHRGSGTNSSCRFMFGFFQEVPDSYVNGPDVDRIGICLDHTKFLWDDDNNSATAEVPWPSCKELSPADAASWGCQKWADSQFASAKHMPSKMGVRMPSPTAEKLVRHTFN